MITSPFVADHPEYQQVELILSSATPEDIIFDEGFSGLSRVKITIDKDVIKPENILRGYSILGVDGIYDATSNRLFIFEDPDVLNILSSKFRFDGEDTLEFLESTKDIPDKTRTRIRRDISIKLFDEKLLELGAEYPGDNVLPYRYQDKLIKIIVDISDDITPDIIKEGVTILGIEGSAPNYIELRFSDEDESVLEMYGTDVRFIDDDTIILDYDNS